LPIPRTNTEHNHEQLRLRKVACNAWNSFLSNLDLYIFIILIQRYFFSDLTQYCSTGYLRTSLQALAVIRSSTERELSSGETGEYYEALQSSTRITPLSYKPLKITLYTRLF